MRFFIILTLALFVGLGCQKENNEADRKALPSLPDQKDPIQNPDYQEIDNGACTMEADNISITYQLLRPVPEKLQVMVDDEMVYDECSTNSDIDLYGNVITNEDENQVHLHVYARKESHKITLLASAACEKSFVLHEKEYLSPNLKGCPNSANYNESVTKWLKVATMEVGSVPNVSMQVVCEDYGVKDSFGYAIDGLCTSNSGAVSVVSERIFDYGPTGGYYCAYKASSSTDIGATTVSAALCEQAQ